MPEPLAKALKEFRRRVAAIAGWIFPGERLPEQPMGPHLFDKWLTAAEQRAELPKLKGGIWHSYRRTWATERNPLPRKDVAEAGGWMDTETLLTCYQRGTMRRSLP